MKSNLFNLLSCKDNQLNKKYMSYMDSSIPKTSIVANLIFYGIFIFTPNNSTIVVHIS